MKNLIEITGVLVKLDQSEITEPESEELENKFLELVEESGLTFGGSIHHQSEKEYLKNEE